MENKDAGLYKPENSLSLTQLHGELSAQGISISLAQLSKFINSDDVADLLQAGGTGQRREFPPDAVLVLTHFFQQFRDAGWKYPQAPSAFGKFLMQQDKLMLERGSLSVYKGSLPVYANQQNHDPIEVAKAQGRAHGLAANDRYLKPSEAAELLGLSRTQFRNALAKGLAPQASSRFGDTSRSDRWKYSDLMLWKQEGETDA